MMSFSRPPFSSLLALSFVPKRLLNSNQVQVIKKASKSSYYDFHTKRLQMDTCMRSEVNSLRKRLLLTSSFPFVRKTATFYHDEKRRLCSTNKITTTSSITNSPEEKLKKDSRKDVQDDYDMHISRLENDLGLEEEEIKSMSKSDSNVGLNFSSPDPIIHSSKKTDSDDFKSNSKSDSQSNENSQEYQSFLYSIFSLLTWIPLCILVTDLIVCVKRVNDESMSPLLEVGDYVLIWKYPVMLLNEIEKGDIVYFRSPYHNASFLSKKTKEERGVGKDDTKTPLENTNKMVESVRVLDQFQMKRVQYIEGDFVRSKYPHEQLYKTNFTEEASLSISRKLYEKKNEMKKNEEENKVEKNAQSLNMTEESASFSLPLSSHSPSTSASRSISSPSSPRFHLVEVPIGHCWVVDEKNYLKSRYLNSSSVTFSDIESLDRRRSSKFSQESDDSKSMSSPSISDNHEEFQSLNTHKLKDTRSGGDSWDYGPISQSLIEGKVGGVLWPPSRSGILTEDIS